MRLSRALALPPRMAPRKAAAHGKKARITVTVDPENIAWAAERVEAGEFRSLSHAVDRGLAALRDQDAKRTRR